MKPERVLLVDTLVVEIYPTRTAMGSAAAARAAAVLRESLAARGRARAMFASAPSQNEFLDALAGTGRIDWRRVAVFHVDEYRGLPSGAPQTFGRFLQERLFHRVHPGNVWLIDGNVRDVSTEIERYGGLLGEAPLDLACIGVGENGHIAFNEPGQADLDDPAPLRLVTVDERSRLQQVHDGCFETLDAVPREAITVTVPAIMRAGSIVCVVPGPTKRAAIRQMLRGPISTDCPASVLRRHLDAVMYLDVEAAAEL